MRVATWEESAFVRECAGIHLGFEDTIRSTVELRELFDLLVYIDLHRVHNNLDDTATAAEFCRLLGTELQGAPTILASQLAFYRKALRKFGAYRTERDKYAKRGVFKNGDLDDTVPALAHALSTPFAATPDSNVVNNASPLTTLFCYLF